MWRTADIVDIGVEPPRAGGLSLALVYRAGLDRVELLGRARTPGGASAARRRRDGNETRSVMWVEGVVDVIGLLWPFGRSKHVEPSVVDPGASTLRVELGDPLAYVQGLNASGWLAEEVLAAGVLRQGKPYSLFGLVTGVALIDWVRARRAKTLPRLERPFLIIATSGADTSSPRP